MSWKLSTPVNSPRPCSPESGRLQRRQALVLLGAGLSGAATANVWAQDTATWDRIAAAGRGQTVYFNAWAGSEAVNRYLQWAAGQLQERFGVRLEHVKIRDAADVVKRVRSEKAADKALGSVDLVWINGENFVAMKREGLLYGPLNNALRNYGLVDVQGKPTTRIDFSEPVDGMEVPWGMAQLTFMVDSKKVAQPPQNLDELLAFARSNPGRVTYPRPPEFHGTTFLKQILLDLGTDRAALYQSATPASIARATAPLWAYLDALHPHLWRAGKQFPADTAQIRQMMGQGELMFNLTFNPNEAANEIAIQRLPASVVSYQFPRGTVGNTHFLAIPFNARSKAGALLVADFLLSPEAQARKADVAVWGDPTVLNVEALPAAQKTLFSRKPLPGQVAITAPALPEPHASWVEVLEREWVKRYGS